MFWRNLLMGLNLSWWAKGTAKRTKNLRKRKSKKMIQNMSVMDRIEYEVALHRERLLRFHSASIDLALDLPPSVPMPDGEEYYQDTRTSVMYHFPNIEQQTEQLCNNYPKPPPNRTVCGRETLYSYLQPESNSSTKRPTNILAGRTVKCLSNKNTQQPQESKMRRVPGPPLCVMVPVSHRSRRLSAFSEKATPGSNLESVPSVLCETPVTSSSTDVQKSSGSSAKEQSHSTRSSANLCENTTNDKKSNNGNRREGRERSTF